MYKCKQGDRVYSDVHKQMGTIMLEATAMTTSKGHISGHLPYVVDLDIGERVLLDRSSFTKKRIPKDS